MSVDLSQFVQAFLEESFEGLDTMENELLGGDLDAAGSSERINTIFRAAHSIKGSAATFGFAQIGEFTHGIETLLDQVRDGRRSLTEDGRALLLEAVDCLRDMLSAARDGTEHDAGAAERTREAIEALLAAGDTAEIAAADAAAEIAAVEAAPEPADGGTSAAGPARWRIEFTPHEGMLRTGNDPLRIFAWLRELGELTVQCDAAAVPSVAELEPESCYLRWSLELRGTVTEAAIREAFEWVADDCDLTITSLTPPAETVAAAGNPTEAAAGAGTEAATGASAAAATEASVAGAAVAPPPATDAADGAPADRRRKPLNDRRADSSSIRVAVEKIDSLVDLVGELVISQAMLETIGSDAEPEEFDAERVERLRLGLAQLERNTRELQEAVLSVRMIPISFVFSRLPRLVRDLEGALGKKVDLVIEGEDTELDKGVIEKLVDPLTHIVRNAVDHGIESPAARRSAGKTETGTLRLRARHQGGNIVIEIEDDGAGLDRERLLAKARERGVPVPENPSDRDVWQLIFAPGFSTADKITDISGRGVGMDVVRQNIESINGRLDIESATGAGTKFTIRLPLTLAILDGMSVRVGEEIFILPLTAILESLQPKAEQLHSISGRGRVVRLRGEYLPLVSLSDVFNLPGRCQRAEEGIVVVVESAQDRAALFVDELIAQHQVVIKSLETNYRRVPGISGATIMGDGRVALILDVDALTQIH